MTMNENKQLRDNLRQVLAYCDELGYELGFAGVEAKQALECRDKQAEPVAWLCEWWDGWQQYHDATDPLPDAWDDTPDKITPLYTHPAQPVQPAGEQELRYTADRALAECPCCGSLDVGGVHDTVNCYGCGLTVTAPRPLQNAINKWNQRTNKAPAPAGAQEPRYWVHNFGDEDGCEEFFDHPTGSDCPDCVPLYLAPPAVAINEQLLEALRDFSNYVRTEQSSTDGHVQYSNTQINRLAFKARSAIAAADAAKGGV